MRSIIEYFSKNHHLTNFLLIAVLLGGVLSWINLRKEEMPEFETDWLSISAAYPGASAEDVEKLVTYEIEKRIRTISGIDEVSSTSSPGRARLSVVLENNLEERNVVIQSIKDAALDASLPERVKETLSFFQWKTSEKAILDLAIYLRDTEFLDYKSRLQLQETADALENQLLALSDISRVRKNNYFDEILEINFNAVKLQALQLPVSEVANQIQSKNIRRPVGALEDQLETKVSVVAELNDVERLKNLVIRNNFEGKKVLLRDVAEISRNFEKPDAVQKINGREAIVVNVYKSSSADIVEASDRAIALAKKFGKNLESQGIQILPMDDESVTVRNRIGIIASNGALGFGLIVISLFVFLDWKSGLWVATGLPFSLAFTAILAVLTGYTVNNITLAAVIIVLGIVVDDAIIVAESISRLKSKGVATAKAVVEGTGSVFLPIIASILTTCFAFFPFYFFGGHFGSFVIYIPSIVTMMLMGSLLESAFILPSHLQDYNIGQNTKPRESKSHWFFTIEGFFAKLLDKLLRGRLLVVLFFIGMMALAAYVFKKDMKFVLFPSEESAEVFLRVEAEDNLDRFAMARKIREIEDRILSSKGLVVAVRSRIGQSRRGGRVRENQASLRIELVNKEERTLTSSQIIEKWEKELKDLQGYKQLRFIKSRFGFSSGSPIEILIQESSDKKRKVLAERLKKELESIDGLHNVELEAPLVNDEYEVDINYEALARLNVSVNALTSSLQAAVGGVDLYTIVDGDKEVDVRLVNVASQRLTITQVTSGFVANNAGLLVPIKSLITVSSRKKPLSIERTNYKRTTEVYADIAEGVKLTPLKVAEKVEEHVFPKLHAEFPTAQMSFRGEVEESRNSQKDFTVSFILAISLIFGILFLLYKSFILPLMILAIVPFGLVGVILAFYMQGYSSFGFFAVVGAIGMAGVVVNDSIVLVSTLREHLHSNDPDHLGSIATLTSSRLRAVLVTTITTVSGLFPTAYGFAGYDAMLSEMMLAMGWGLIFGTMITLVLTPILFSYYESSLRLVRRLRGTQSDLSLNES